MRTVSEYLAKVSEFRTAAANETDPVLKKRFADLADSYQVMADERRRMLAAGEIEPDGPPQLDLWTPNPPKP